MNSKLNQKAHSDSDNSEEPAVKKRDLKAKSKREFAIDKAMQEEARAGADLKKVKKTEDFVQSNLTNR